MEIVSSSFAALIGETLSELMLKCFGVCTVPHPTQDKAALA